MASLPATLTYQRTRYSWWIKATALVSLVLLGMMMGLLVALAPPQLLIIPALPVLVLAGCALWMLPNLDRLYYTTMAGLAGWYVLAQSIWPSYIALNAPGLPWITPTRMLVGVLVAVVIYSVGTSRRLRAEMGETLSTLPRLKLVFWAFWVVTVITIPATRDPVLTITKWVNNQIFWTGSLLVGAWLSRRAGFADRVGKALVWTAVVTATVGMWEWHKQITPWIDHIPGFLKVDPEYLDHVLASQTRAGSDVYRLHSTYATSLSYAEYMALVFPFVIHYFMRTRTTLRRLVMFAGIVVCAFAMYWTNARSGVIGFFSSIFLSVLFGAYRRWRNNPGQIGPAATLFAYPAAALIFVVLVFTWPRLHVAVIGGGAQQASSQAREMQWSSGARIVAKNPFGHGAGRAALTLNFVNPAGDLTIDTYYLSLLLEYGVVGFVLFVGLFAWSAWVGFWLFVRGPPGEATVAGPLAIGLFNFVVVKSVLSSEINVPIAFLMSGLVFGLAYQQRVRDLA